MSDQTDNIDRVVRRLNSSMSGAWEACIYGVVEEMEQVCESPIEIMLGSAIVLGGMLADGPGRLGKPFFKMQSQNALNLDAAIFVLVPQFHWNNYRIDFAMLGVGLRQPVFVECDGHDFHERTKDQAARDRSKDRAIQEAGLTVLRFTGSEIYRDPDGCAAQIYSVLSNRVRGAQDT